MKWASRRSIARARMPTKMERKPAHKSMGLGCLFRPTLSTGERPPAYILADECALPVNLCNSGIGAGLGFRNRRACCRDVQDPAAHGHDVGPASFRPGMEQGDAGQGGSLVQG